MHNLFYSSLVRRVLISSKNVVNKLHIHCIAFTVHVRRAVLQNHPGATGHYLLPLGNWKNFNFSYKLLICTSF